MTFEKSSGNVFADIGFANPEREQLKAQLTLQIYRFIKDRDLAQAEAGTILGMTHVSALMRNRSGNFSVERLMDFLIALGQDVEITVRPTRKEHGQVSIVLAPICIATRLPRLHPSLSAELRSLRQINGVRQV